MLYLPPYLYSYILEICLDPIDIDEALYGVMSEIVMAAMEGEIKLEK